MTNREAGINVVREMMGDQAAAKLTASAGSHTFGASIAGYAVDQVFADIWTRPGLDRRSHTLAILPSQQHWLLLPRLSRSVVWTSTKTTLATAACFDTQSHPHCRC